MTDFSDLADAAQISSIYLADRRETASGRPWLTLGMISSLDGSAVVDGGSTALGGPPDRQVFRALRAVADVILVGAGTVRAEGYGAPRLPADLVEWRREQGLSDAPRVAIVTRSLQVTPTPSLASTRPLVFTTRRSMQQRGGEVKDWAEVVIAGDDRIDPGSVLAQLGERGADRVLLEGGPRLNGIFPSLLDEICLTVAPLVASGAGSRIVMGEDSGRSATLDRVIHSDGFLLLRYLFQESLAPLS
ncbi:MAG: dihydrofolate reductase family protein [Acidimicrobiia bacterium]|nr:dihydrofolate reductase family protein [Acidimicrobiia bacterium]